MVLRVPPHTRGELATETRATNTPLRIFATFLRHPSLDSGGRAPVYDGTG